MDCCDLTQLQKLCVNIYKEGAIRIYIYRDREREREREREGKKKSGIGYKVVTRAEQGMAGQGEKSSAGTAGPGKKTTIRPV